MTMLKHPLRILNLKTKSRPYSVIKSAIAPETIDVENPNVDVSQINRDINYSLQA